MYFQNPRFGFFFLELVAERLMRDANLTTMTPDTVPNHDASNPSAAYPRSSRRRYGKPPSAAPPQR